MMDSFRPDVVVHLASWGMSGAPMLNPKCRAVNIGGVEAVLEAMRQTDTDCLLYTSTYNVIYGGEPIENGNEQLDYFDLSRHTDAYSASKAEAEQMVLASNGKDNLRTMSLRPAAIYGCGEERHFPRIIKHIDSGLFAFRIGSGSIVDWVHVDNLTQAFVKSIDKLVAEYNPRKSPCGQAYFISDGTPVDNFEFLRPLVHARGREFPEIVMPVWLALGLATVFEVLHLFLGVEPFMTRAEVYKVGVTHYFSIAKAKAQLGYAPTISSDEGASFMGMEHALRQRRGFPCQPSYFFRLAPLSVWLLVGSGMIALYWIAFFGDQLDYFPAPLPTLLPPLLKFGLFIFRSQANLQILFRLAVSIHALEACWAVKLAEALGVVPHLRVLWFLQTLALGIGSLRLLRHREHQLRGEIQ
jgi:nucleoside-diphosphate-sugar epimerase